MSWVSRRETTRAEDIAYCLFGLFDVHMPPLYGEGAKNAFLRLQEEIIKKSTDMSILAWYGASENYSNAGALASSPAMFGPCQYLERDNVVAVAPFKLTSGGLRIKLPLIQCEGYRYIAILPNCVYSKNGPGISDKDRVMGLSLHWYEKDDVCFQDGSPWKAEPDGTLVPRFLMKRSELKNAKVRKIYIL
jgi:hypothetical protein